MKKIFILLFLLGVVTVSEVYGQERQQYRFSQHFLKPHAVNPSLSGIEDFWQINTGYRKQWAGLEASPETYFLSFNGVLRKPDYRLNSVRISHPEAYEEQETDEAYRKRMRKHGIGGYVTNMEMGRFRVMSGLLSYAYHIPLNRKMSLAVGVSAGLTNNGFGKGDYQVRHEDDELYLAMMNGGVNSSLYDVNVGTTLYGKRFYLGYAVNQLVMYRSTSTDNLQKPTTYLHHYANLGYQLNLNYQWILQPSLLLRYDPLNEARFDANVKLRYDDLFWFGGSYRNKETVAGLFGLVLNKDVTLAYAYELSIGEFQMENNGTHEVVLGIRLGNKYRKSPYFW